jgi:hypothetical protein
VNAREQAAKAIVDDVKDRTGITIPWEILIPILIDLFEQCFNTEATFVDAARAPSVIQIVLLRRICIRRLRGTYDVDRGTVRVVANAMVDATFSFAASWTDDNLVAAFRNKDAA